MTIEEKIKNLKQENLLIKIMLTIIVLTLGMIAINETYVHNKIIAKITEISSKVGVECMVKTNSPFGVFTKMKLIK